MHARIFAFVSLADFLFLGLLFDPETSSWSLLQSWFTQRFVTLHNTCFNNPTRVSLLTDIEVGEILVAQRVHCEVRDHLALGTHLQKSTRFKISSTTTQFGVTALTANCCVLEASFSIYMFSLRSCGMLSGAFSQLSHYTDSSPWRKPHTRSYRQEGGRWHNIFMGSFCYTKF